MKFVTLALAALLLFAAPIATAQKVDIKKLNDAVVLLYQQDVSGDQKMACTGTVYRKMDKGYRIASAAHCVEGDKDSQQKQLKFFVTLDTAGAKTFIPVKLVEAGDKTLGDDFSIFETTGTEEFAVIPLGDSDKLALGENVESIAAPFGLGKQYFRGYVSTGQMDRPPVEAGDSVRWHDIFLVEIGGGPGSSGSSIVSDNQGAIVGFLVGSIPGSTVGKMILPVNQFKAFEAKVDAHTYKKTMHDKNESDQ